MLKLLLVGNVDCLGLYSQVIKCMWWMPWQSEAMKDVIACEKLRGGGKYPVIRRCLNGEPDGLSGRYHKRNKWVYEGKAEK